MARINTNIPAIIAQANLTRTNADLALRLERLSTGLRINHGSDDPAGLIVSDRLRSEIRGLSQAVTNTERAGSVVATVEGNLVEVANLLQSIKGIVVETASRSGLSREEVEANQLQVDSAIDSINRIADSATFAGLQLLDGTLSYLTSGIETGEISSVNVFGAQIDHHGHVPVEVEVVGSAQTASLFLSGNTVGAPGALLSSVTIEITGTLGIQSLRFLSGTSLSDVCDAVNAIRDATGVSASLVTPGDDTSGLTFNSVGYGSSQFVSVRRVGQGGDFFSVYEERDGAETTRDQGADVEAMINGSLAQGNGLSVQVHTPALSLELKLDASYAQQVGATSAFEITGGGAKFQIGPAIAFDQQVGLGIESVSGGSLGGALINGVPQFLESLKTGQANSLILGKAQDASAILDSAIDGISVMRGRLGAFDRNHLDTNIRSLSVGLESVTAAESQVRDADFAAETAALTRAQILAQAGTAVLATANVTTQNVLELLR